MIGSIEASNFSPKPPPTGGTVTRTRPGGSCMTFPVTLRTVHGTCVDVSICARPFSHEPMATRGSNGMWL